MNFILKLTFVHVKLLASADDCEIPHTWDDTSPLITQNTFNNLNLINYTKFWTWISISLVCPYNFQQTKMIHLLELEHSHQPNYNLLKSMRNPNLYKAFQLKHSTPLSSSLIQRILYSQTKFSTSGT